MKNIKIVYLILLAVFFTSCKEEREEFLLRPLPPAPEVNNPEPILISKCGDLQGMIKIDETALNVAIPDSNFERNLIVAGYDTDGIVNHKILRSDAEKVIKIATNSSGVYYNPEDVVKNVKGIEYFTNLEEFLSLDQLIDSVDFSQNKKLKRVTIINDSGRFFGASKEQSVAARALKYVNLGTNPNLKTLRFENVAIKEINLSGLLNLELLSIKSDSLSTVYINNLEQVKPTWEVKPVINPKSKISFKICSQ